MDRSRHITTRNRRHLRRIPGKVMDAEFEEDEGEEEQERVLVYTRVPVPAVPVPATAAPRVPAPAAPVAPTAPAGLAVPVDPGPAVHSPAAPAGPAVPVENKDGPRRSGRSRSGPDRLVVTGQGKSYSDVVQEVNVKSGKEVKAVEAVKPSGKGGCVHIVPMSDQKHRRWLHF